MDALQVAGQSEEGSGRLRGTFGAQPPVRGVRVSQELVSPSIPNVP